MANATYEGYDDDDYPYAGEGYTEPGQYAGGWTGNWAAEGRAAPPSYGQVGYVPPGSGFTPTPGMGPQNPQPPLSPAATVGKHIHDGTAGWKDLLMVLGGGVGVAISMALINWFRRNNKISLDVFDKMSKAIPDGKPFPKDAASEAARDLGAPNEVVNSIRLGIPLNPMLGRESAVDSINAMTTNPATGDIVSLPESGNAFTTYQGDDAGLTGPSAGYQGY